MLYTLRCITAVGMFYYFSMNFKETSLLLVGLWLRVVSDKLSSDSVIAIESFFSRASLGFYLGVSGDYTGGNLIVFLRFEIG